MGRIIFVPTCENCGYEFTHLTLSEIFNIQCPKCECYINSLLFPKYDYLAKENFNTFSQFHYDKQELYGA